MLLNGILPFLPLISLATAKPQTDQQPPPSCFQECIAKAFIPVLFPKTAAFSSAISPFNRRIKYIPYAVTIPYNTAQVKTVVDCARTSGLRVTARSGGHAYNAQGLGGEDGHVIVDLKRMHNVRYDATTTYATVGAGTRLGNLAVAIYDQGRRAIPHGTCPEIGVGGHSLHGGFGFASRMWGLMVDNIHEVEVVTAAGQILTASEKQNPDLFWALKGAGPSFGIVTKLVFKTYAATESNVVYTYKWANLKPADRAKLFSTISDWSTGVPKELAVSISISSWPKEIIQFSGVYYGKTRADFDNIMKPLLSNLSSPSTSEVGIKGWIGTMKQFAGGDGNLDQDTENYDKHDIFFAKSLVTREDQPISRTDLENFYQYGDEMGDSMPAHYLYSWFVIANLDGGKNSVINNADLLNGSSYALRSGHWTFQFYSKLSSSTWLNAATNQTLIGFTDNFHKSLGTRSGDRAYINYVDPTLSRKDAHRLYYGRQLGRLEEVKAKYDAGNLFYYPQSINPKGGVRKMAIVKSSCNG